MSNGEVMTTRERVDGVLGIERQWQAHPHFQVVLFVTVLMLALRTSRRHTR